MANGNIGAHHVVGALVVGFAGYWIAKHECKKKMHHIWMRMHMMRRMHGGHPWMHHGGHHMWGGHGMMHHCR